MTIKRRTVLLVEDDPVRAMMVQALLTDSGSCVVTTDNVSDALRILKNSAISACVVDLGVYRNRRDYDERGGIEFISQARAVGHRLVPIVVVTGSPDVNVVVRCFEAGCDDYVSKVEGVEKAVARVKRLLMAEPTSAKAMAAKRQDVIRTLRSQLAA